MNAKDHTPSAGATAGPQLDAEQMAAVDAVIARHQGKPGSLIPVLEDIQELLGYIPLSVQARVAAGMGAPLSEVHGVVTFYHFFTMTPRGRHTIRCCLGTACYVRGSQGALRKLENSLGVKQGGTTEDLRFSLETVRCLGACGLAPVIMVDEDTHRQVKPSGLEEILKDYQ